MKKPQWIAVGAALVIGAVFLMARTVPEKKPVVAADHQHDKEGPDFLPTDSILAVAKKQLTEEQVLRLNFLENSVTRGDVKDQQVHVYHQLARFWADSAGIFEPYAWYTAEAARLENSEKSLTFAARLFLENLQQDGLLERRQWKALQAKDLFERSLIINPGNDSATVGLGACYLFGNISEAPMEGIGKIRAVLDKDSTNTYALGMMAKGSLLSGQYDKAITRLETLNRLEPRNLETLFMLAECYERMGDKENAVRWYKTSLPLITIPEMKKAVEERLDVLNH